MLEIVVRESNGVTVLDLKGRLIFGDETQMLGRRVRELFDEGQKSLLLNFADLDFIDSSGIGEVIASFTSLRKNGGALKLCSAVDRVAEVLNLVKLPQIIQVFDTEQEAVDSFG